MTISKMDRAMLSFGLIGGLLVPRTRTPAPAKPARPPRPR
jgi:hypothetical protein